MLWLAAGLIGGTIALEVWFANRRLNDDMAALRLWLDDAIPPVKEEDE